MGRERPLLAEALYTSVLRVLWGRGTRGRGRLPSFLPSFGSLRGETLPSCRRSLVAEGLTVRGEHSFLNSPNLSALGSSYRARGTLYAAQLGKPENRRAPYAAKRSRDGRKARQWARTASGAGVSVRLWTEASLSCIAALRPGRVAIHCARPFLLFFFFFFLRARLFLP